MLLQHKLQYHKMSFGCEVGGILRQRGREVSNWKNALRASILRFEPALEGQTTRYSLTLVCLFFCFFFGLGTPPPLCYLSRQNIIQVIKWTRPSPSIFAHCKQSKTGRWEGLGKRLDLPSEKSLKAHLPWFSPEIAAGRARVPWCKPGLGTVVVRRSTIGGHWFPLVLGRWRKWDWILVLSTLPSDTPDLQSTAWDLDTEGEGKWE